MFRSCSTEVDKSKDFQPQPSPIGSRTANREFKQLSDCEWGDPEPEPKMKSKSVYLSKRLPSAGADIVTMASRPRAFALFTGMYGAAPHDTKLLEASDDESDDEEYEYPGGWKRAVLLACALVPYMIVSCHP